MNNFETTLITPNIAFLHQNLAYEKSSDFNGTKSNYYLIAFSIKGNIILIETKGDQRDNTESVADRHSRHK